MIKRKLKNNEVSYGSWITIPHHAIVEILATAGFEWLVIDLEHTSISFSDAEKLILAIESKGMVPLVRVGSNDSLIIKRVMDSGASGVIVPMINSKEEAEKAVNSIKYPPSGLRGVGLYRAQDYGIGFKNYKSWLEKESICIAQIEHKSGVENITDIINVDGIDGIIVGPYDLSSSFGFPGEFENREFLDSINKIEEACSKNNFPLGYHVINPNYKEVLQKKKLGYTFLGFSLDFLFLGNKARDEMNKLKNEKK